MRDHGTLIEFRAEPKRGQRECREQHCPKCGQIAPHEFVCLQGRGPRVWLMQCTNCRRQRRELERGE